MIDVHDNSLTPDGIEARLWDYIDGTGNDKERIDIEQLIAANSKWRMKYEELMDIHSLVQSVELEQPSMRFTKNVMEGIARFHIAPATKKYIDQKIIWSIGLFFITVIVGFIVYGFSQVDWSAGGSAEGAFGIDFSVVDYSKMFNNTYINLFMMLNVVLGLMLLDRYLDNKNSQYKKSL
jgi:hypothetical protein